VGSLLDKGEPGIGKSALLGEAKQRAERLGVQVLSTTGRSPTRRSRQRLTQIPRDTAEVGRDVRLTHIGGRTLLIEAAGWRLLTDPTGRTGRYGPPGRPDRAYSLPELETGPLRPAARV
jgi:hypothetical protein